MASKEVKCARCDQIIYVVDKCEIYEGKVCFYKTSFDKISSIFIDLS